jgi:hypothetical protein
MGDVRRARILGIAVLLLSGILRPAEGRTSAVPPEQLQGPLSDNLKMCDEMVRNGIAKAQRQWGPFHFDCFDRSVFRIQASSRSKIIGQWPKFVVENAELFDIDPAGVSPGQSNGKLVTVVQNFHGTPIYPKFGSNPSAYKATGMDLIVATDFTKTKSWAFGATISSDAASKIAEAEWADSALVDGDSDRFGQVVGVMKYVWAKVTNSNAKVKESHLRILTDQPVCSECPFELPAPVWSVTSHKGEGICEINAVTGEICRPCSMVARPCSL